MGKAAKGTAKFKTLKEEQEIDLRYEKYKNIIAELTIMSDIFMRNVLKKQACTEHLLQVIMGRDDLQIKEQILQKDYKNLQGRSAVLDCVACDREKKRYNVEIQQESEGASAKRARYHSALMDMNILESGQGFNELPGSYIIFITREDVLGYGLPIYHIDRRIKEVKEDFPDETHIIYVNVKMKNEKTKLGRLMHDLQCKNADEMYSEILAERVRELKETPEGVENMCREMDEIYHEGIEVGEKRGERRGEKRGKKQGEMKAKKETAVTLLEMGMSVDKIALAVKESTDLVQKWIAEGMAAVK
ncbi:Rpn family recombination-promoting nuclease/putative transposase [Claveliimonas bilis]|uniref:Rpn family recombination-promoting nuclease/putative transposase n=1 Tax=Clostridia TaxID=186801 RepID=UPI001E298DE2|nr:Rpn family recombination-promoting nuclease/putative transposase [Claveliimonas bilis]MCQ5202028.1 Rpn family recombination-promoting nuclease/putative transposase [Mordavella massiliensis]BCZ27813.1 hypothetical protein EUBC25_19000 [Claveliimonas bilis]